MESETKNCQNCKKDFTIEPDDFSFYEKIKVPAPTWCPECRQRRRYSWRNERLLYRRNCDLCGKSTVTIYSPNKPFKVYCPSCWWSDKWNGYDFGRDFDFSKPFFPQWQELQLQVPRIALLAKNSVNSEYTNHSDNNKNCYLGFGIFNSENILYSSNVWKNANNCSDCTMITEGGTLLYECVDSKNCYKCQFLSFCRDCTDCYYCYDCRGCQNCFFSYNLRNQQYCIQNKQYTKEEYFKKITEFNLSSSIARQKLWEQYALLVKNEAIRKASEIEQSVNVSGSMIFNCKNVKNSFDVYDMEDSKNVTLSLEGKDSMDSYHFGFKSELVYESHALIRAYNVLFSHLCYDDSDIMYCDSCHNGQNLFGCVGVKQGEYSIFNKKYLQQEYIALKGKIISHMKETKEFGEFFPPQLSPFGYNETQGQIYMPLTKEEAQAGGFKWEDQLPGTFGKETIKPEQMPDSIQETGPSILKEILVCALCKKNYNIVQSELDFYKSQNVPIPCRCPDCRYRARIAQRPRRQTATKTCTCDKASHFHGEGKCPNEFETPFSTEDSAKIYCKECYNAEVA